MEEKLCSIHEDDVISVCFFEGCSQHLLCQECIKGHPDSHNSQAKNIMSLMRKDDWITLNEDQRDSQIAQLKSCYQEKDDLISENQNKLKSMIDEIIECLSNRLSQWIKELNMTDKPETKEPFAKLEDILDRLVNINFREGDIYDKVDKTKLFNESILPESVELCKQIQEAVDKSKIGSSKVDACKQEVLELIQDIHLKDFFNSYNNRRQKDSEQLDLLQQEYENFKRDKIQEIKKLNEDLEHLKTINNGLQAELKSMATLLVDLNNDYIQKTETLTGTNNELQNKTLQLKKEFDLVIGSKLKLQTELEGLKAAQSKVIEQSSKAELLSEFSRIIQEKDVNNIRDWIPNPTNSDESRRCKLNLLYRATQDGFTRVGFENKCKDKNPTIAFIKSKEHGRVFGGYTTKNWKFKGTYIEDKEAFLFSLTHGEKYPIKTPEYAIIGRPEYILGFGGGHDIIISENCYKNSDRTYSNFAHSYQCSRFPRMQCSGASQYLVGDSCFAAEDIEVYQVVWL